MGNPDSQKYNQLLNNLLDIKSRGDQAIFTHVNNIDSFDVYSKFGPKEATKTIDQKQFTFLINEVDIQDLINEVRQATNAVEVTEAYEKYNERLTNVKKLALEKSSSFDDVKESLLEDLEQKQQRERLRWKQFRRKILDLNIQTNVWPAYVATGFVTIATSKRDIYAPFFLKEITIELDKSDNPFIRSESDWQINEKLLFALKDNGIDINKNLFENIDSLDEMTKILSHNLQVEIDSKDFLNRFQSKKNGTIKNKTLNFESGIVLGIFSPGGGALRQKLTEIINNDEINDILDPEVDKNIYKKNISNYIVEKSDQLYYIQPSNFSQDRALISSLIEDTVIWGPPGTGKSQVIANIIANLFAKNKTGLVVSQKKAALDVLKKRLKSLAPFVFFMLNDNNLDKKEFYKPLQNFIEMIENHGALLNSDKKKLISPNELAMLNIISKAKKDGTYPISLEILDGFNGNLPLIQEFFQLNSNYQYPLGLNDLKAYKKEFVGKNNIAYKHFLGIKYLPKDLNELIQTSYDLLTKGTTNVNDYLTYLNQTTYSNVEQLYNASNVTEHITQFISDEDYLRNLLANKIIFLVLNWKKTDREKYKKYVSFANAIRAGKSLPYKFLNNHAEIIEELFPVIVTTPEAILSKWDKQKFDYAIIDESSQMFLEVGLPILYLAKIRVLAGDTKQMQPSRWFQTRDEEQTDEDIPENANSLLDYALDKGVYSIMLDQNYRSSSASLMSFSSREFYDSQLNVVDEINLRTTPIEVINVDGQWNDGINEVEAKRVIEITEKILDNYESIIVLTFNVNQRQYIEREILDHEKALTDAIESGKLSVKNIENIQGDEADAIVVSVVYDPTTSIASTYVARPGGMNALNVAVSRAKDRMIVVKSITAYNVRSAKSEDFLVFKRWLNFLDLSQEEQKGYTKQEDLETYKINESYGEEDSGFERDVIDFIKNNVFTNRELKLIKQYEVGSYSIDIAIVDQKTNQFILGIEVDGYRYHEGMGFDKYLNDYSRQNFLEAKGYPIYRIKEIDFRIHRKKILKELATLLNY